MKVLYGINGKVGTVTDDDYNQLFQAHADGLGYMGSLDTSEFIDKYHTIIGESKAKEPSMILCKQCKMLVQNDVEFLLQHEDCCKEYRV